MQSTQSPLWAAHNWGRLICVVRARVCVMQHRRALHTTKEEMQRLCSLKDNTQRDGEIECAWLYNFFFPWMFSPSTLCLCRPELFILHKEKRNAKGYKDNQNGESFAWDTQTTPTHTSTSTSRGITSYPRTRAGMFTYWGYMQTPMCAPT